MPDVDIYSYTDQAGTKYHFRDGRTQYKTYDSVTDLGLTSGSATLSAAYTAMPSNSIYIGHCTDFSTNQYPSGASDGSIEIVKVGGGWCGYINWYGRTANGGDFRMYVTGSPSLPTGTWIPLSTYTATGNFAANGNYTTTANNHISFVKCGRIVQMSGYIQPTVQVPAFQSLGTAPVGFRPKNSISLQLIPAGRSTFPYWVYLDTAGVAGVQDVALPANIKYYVSATYIIS